ncbi:MAG: 5-oxoprolinase subunit PxpB [Athalassotoga sp.]|uniref:5-oxoprolinase subunit PxpB n=1 Tax=Athalassotoga sp. TaxID=2022597 RepID=UPI003D003CA8
MVIEEMGERAIIVKFGDEISPDAHKMVIALDRFLAGLKTLFEWIPSYASVTIFYDPEVIGHEEIVRIIGQFRPEEIEEVEKETIEVPVMYGSKYGPDIEFVSDLNKMTVEEFIKFHSSFIYEVWMMGFMPGFAYLYGYTGSKVPRLERPRKYVMAGSVGIAGNQCGIYPFDSPGGWRIIGRTELKIFDIHKNPPSLFDLGKRVRFIPI